MADDDSDKTSVRVAIRCRPLTPKEQKDGVECSLQVISGEPQIFVKECNKAFTFDYVFSHNATQEAVYNSCVHHLVGSIFQGYNATVLAYGQTGSGKTHTMGTAGPVDGGGIIQRAVANIFSRVLQSGNTFVKASFLEIYKEDVFDLLVDRHLRESLAIREDGVGVKIAGLLEVNVNTAEDVFNLLERASLRRQTASTNMNSTSSRSHAVFTLIVTQEKTVAKFHLVDLAGSERAKRTGAQGERLKEGININRGLLALGNVISALCDRQFHIPYRDSKLTRLLQDSLGGNSQTVMIACVSQADINLEETLNTLRYADRARKIQNKPLVNLDPKIKEIGFLKGRILQLEEQWQEHMRNCQMGKTQNQPSFRKKRTLMVQKTVGEKDERQNKDGKTAGARMGSENPGAQMGRENPGAEMDCENPGAEMDCENPGAHMGNENPGAHMGCENPGAQMGCENPGAQMGHENPGAEMGCKNPGADVGYENADALNLDDDMSSSEDMSNEELMLELDHINKELALKERHFNAMASNQGELEILRFEYEDRIRELTQEIDQLNTEKHQLLAAVSAPNNAFKVSEERRKRIQQLEQKLTGLHKDLQGKQRMLRMKEEVENKSKLLQRDIMDLKRTRVRLMKQMQKDAIRFKQIEMQLKKKELHADAVEMRSRRQLQKSSNEKAVLQRKLAEANNVKRRLQKALDRQQNSKRAGNHSSPNPTEIHQWVSNEVNVEVHKMEAQRHLDQLKEDRALLSEQLRHLEDQSDEPTPPKLPKEDSPTDWRQEEIDRLKLELEERSSQIADIHEKLFHAESDPKDRFSSILKMDDAFLYLGSLFDATVSARLSTVILERKLSEMENAAAQLSADLQQQKSEHELQLQRERIASDDKILYLMKQNIQNSTQNEEAKDVFSEFTDGEISRLSYMNDELLRKSEQCQKLQQEVKYLKKKPRKVHSPKKSVDSSDSDSDCVDELDQDEEISKKDPDWVQTPIFRRQRRKLTATTRLSQETKEDREEKAELKRNSSAMSCKCQGKCNTKHCGCQKKGRRCAESCLCVEGNCENRTDKENSDPRRNSVEDFDTTFVLPKNRTHKGRSKEENRLLVSTMAEGIYKLQKRKAIYTPANDSFFGTTDF